VERAKKFLEEFAMEIFQDRKLNKKKKIKYGRVRICTAQRKLSPG